ncbi:hypothetical protein L7F22_039632 [Adiantum nelumboides]|nr:hypothetical protein [Adiantum nelumboides]
MAPRRRVLQVSDSSSSSSEGIAKEATAEAATVGEDDIEVIDSPGSNDDIELLETPTHGSFSNGAARDAFSANPNLDPPCSNPIRPLFSASAPSSSSPFPRGNNAQFDTPLNMTWHSRTNGSAAFHSSPSALVDLFPTATSTASRHAALEALLQSRGARPTPQWLDACVERLTSSRAGFLQLSDSQQAEICFSHLLFADLNIMGAAVLPPQIHTLHATELAGPFVLQVDEITDIGAPICQRYKERQALASRCLKLSMTDGVQRIYGIEYRPIRALNVLSPAGLKIAVAKASVQNLLAEDDSDSGCEDDDIPLLANLWSFPGVLYTLRDSNVMDTPEFQMALFAYRSTERRVYWMDANSVFLGGDLEKVVVHHVNIRRGLLLLVPETVIVLGGQVERLEVARQRVVQHVNKPPRGSRSLRGATPQSLAESASCAAWDNVQARQSTSQSSERLDESLRAPISGSPSARASAYQNREDSASGDTSNVSNRGADNTGFTYLSLLKKQWASNQPGASNMHGKVKFVLTGVKEFQFKDREQFKLVVYIDDGSQIASVLIHNQVTQQLIGFSARQVSAALASTCPDEVIKMKGILSRFQAFLTKFEGIAQLQRVEEIEIPVVTELTEGCSKHEAWSLAARLRGSSERSVPLQDTQPIELSP